VRVRWIALSLVLAAGAAALVVRPWEHAGPSPSIADGPSTGPTSSAPTLAAKPTASALKPSAAPRGAVVGTVRRRGEGVPSWLEIYERHALDPAVLSSWTADADIARGLSAERTAAKPVGAAPSGSDGRFAFERLTPGEYEVVASEPGGSRGSARATIDADGARVAVEVTVYGGKERLSGRAVHADGKPFVGEVAATPSDDATEGDAATNLALRFVRTDADGKFVLEGLDVGDVAVVARRLVRGGGLSFAAESRPVSLPRSEEFVFTVDGGLGELSGRVVADADGGPVAGALVLTRAFPNSVRAETQGLATTDADGRFAIASPVGDQGQLRVRAAGFAPVLRSPPDPLAPIELRLVRVARVTGRVTSSVDGAPVGGVDVYACPGGDPLREGSHAVSGTDGRYAMNDVGPGERSIVAIGHGWILKALAGSAAGGWNPFTVDVPAGGSIERDLVVVPAGRVAGRVVDPDGHPVRGASVRWHAADAEPSAFTAGSAFVLHRDVATADDGTFLLDAIPPAASIEVEATAPGFSPGRSAKVMASAVIASQPSAVPPVVEIRLLAPR
jgi:protocatechuate 3,4-dioxygenase beta subunit